MEWLVTLAQSSDTGSLGIAVENSGIAPTTFWGVVGSVVTFVAGAMGFIYREHANYRNKTEMAMSVQRETVERQLADEREAAAERQREIKAELTDQRDRMEKRWEECDEGHKHAIEKIGRLEGELRAYAPAGGMADVVKAAVEAAQATPRQPREST